MLQIIHDLKSTAFLSLKDPGLLIILILAAVILLVLMINFFHRWNKKNHLLREKNIQLEKMNIQLKTSEEQLKKMNATKTRLFSIIAHDLRSSMNAILGFSEIIANKQKSLSESQLNKYSNLINQSAHKVYFMMENLLEWSRAQGANIRFNPVNFDLNSTATNVITLLEIKAYQKNVDFTSVVPKPCIINGDKIMVASILRNLLDNALKFTPTGGQIEVSAREETGMIEVWVRDNGIGMEPEQLTKLFQGVSHTSTEGTEHEKGSGLGLFICRDFIEMHGGTIWAESNKNSGTIFKFRLPPEKL